MNCPTCNITLLMTDRQGVEIDYCPQCRGIWLDRGELEKIIERSPANNSMMGEVPGFPPIGHSEDHYSKHDDHHDTYDQYGRRRKKGFLGELFDF